MYSYSQVTLLCYVSICLPVLKQFRSNFATGMVHTINILQFTDFCQSYGPLMIFMFEWFWAEFYPLNKKVLFVVSSKCTMFSIIRQLGNSALKKQNRNIHTKLDFTIKLSNNPSDGYHQATHVITLVCYLSLLLRPFLKSDQVSFENNIDYVSISSNQPLLKKACCRIDQILITNKWMNCLWIIWELPLSNSL